MKSTDRFLLLIVAAILLLAGGALALALTRDTPAYLPEDTPGAVAYNYLLALNRYDDPRAYGYLDPDLAGYPPTVDGFTGDVDRAIWRGERGSVSFAIAAAQISDGRAVVTIDETRFFRDGLFGSNQDRSSFSVTLRRKADGWKVISAGAYWVPCWTNPERCR